MYENLYTLNGVGGRGFVLAPYLANILSEFVVNGEEMPKEVLNYRLFKRWAKKEGKSVYEEYFQSSFIVCCWIWIFNISYDS